MNEITLKDRLFNLLEIKGIRERLAYQQERWITSGKDNTCPMCADLENLGWLPLGTLPRYKHAHSELGEGRWKAPDSSCGCVKGYKRAAGPNPGRKQLEYVPGYGWIAVETGLATEAKEKVKIIMAKYEGKCTCKG